MRGYGWLLAVLLVLACPEFSKAGSATGDVIDLQKLFVEPVELSDLPDRYSLGSYVMHAEGQPTVDVPGWQGLEKLSFYGSPVYGVNLVVRSKNNVSISDALKFLHRHFQLDLSAAEIHYTGQNMAAIESPAAYPYIDQIVFVGPSAAPDTSVENHVSSIDIQRR